MNVVLANNSVPCLLPNNELRFGRYTLLYRFATGGMANLYAAKLLGTDGFSKTVAIKMMHSHLASDPEFVKMFIDEARLASRISHPNVVQILELGRVKETHYIAMEYLESESVRALLQRTKPPIPCCVQVAICVASGLHAAHELRDGEGRLLDVVHRDVSPDNILISYDGAVKIVDFGVARTRDSLHTTTAGSLKGKFGYMAPEQATAGMLDRRVDVFALGIVLYEMTTCRRLFRRPTDAETLQAVKAGRFMRPSQLVKDYPKELERIVIKALAHKPSARFESALQLQEALEDYMVSSGNLQAHSALGGLMRDVFGDRINKRKEIRLSFSGVNQAIVPDVGLELGLGALELQAEVATAAMPLPLAASGASWVAPPRRRGAWLALTAAACTVVLIAGVGALYLLGWRWGGAPARAVQGPRLQRAVQRSGRPVPSATRALSGRQTAASPRPAHRAVVVRHRRRVRPRSSTRRRRSRRADKRSQGLVDRDVLANPYER